jgi:hypothetical protein
MFFAIFRKQSTVMSSVQSNSSASMPYRTINRFERVSAGASALVALDSQDT